MVRVQVLNKRSSTMKFAAKLLHIGIAFVLYFGSQLLLRNIARQFMESMPHQPFPSLLHVHFDRLKSSRPSAAGFLYCVRPFGFRKVLGFNYHE